MDTPAAWVEVEQTFAAIRAQLDANGGENDGDE
jgi:hypothetical protein